MAYDLKSESEVKEYINKLGIEYRFGCYSEKKPEVCHLLGDYLEAVKKDFEKAGRVFKNNCEEFNFPKSCYKYGKYLLVGKGQGNENFKEAYSYFDKGCKLNDTESCLHQGLMLVSTNKIIDVTKDVRKGMEILDKACSGKNANACYYLSGMYISGVRKDQYMNIKPVAKKDEQPAPTEEEMLVPKDMKKAFRYAMSGCSLGNMYSCANLSQMYQKGEGTEKNNDLAEKYKKMALDMQDEAVNEKNTLTFQEGLSST